MAAMTLRASLLRMALGLGLAVLASFLSVALFDFFFVAPRLSLAVSDVQYVITFVVMLAVGLITGQLTAGLRYEARVSSEREARARGLFELTRELAGALQTEQVVATAEQQLAQQFGGRALLYVLDDDDRLQPSPSEAALPPGEGSDAGTARWALDHEQAAGQGTDTLPGSQWFYLPLRAPMRTRWPCWLRCWQKALPSAPPSTVSRSEEHTSELQSR